MDCSNLVSDNLVRRPISQFITLRGEEEGANPEPIPVCPINL